MAKALALSKAVKVEEYKGKPILCLNPEVDQQFMKFNIGVNKAKLILAVIDDIRTFVAMNEGAPAPSPAVDKKKKGAK